MEKKLENYIANLTKMINVKTISKKNSFDKEVFDEFVNVLKETFPNIFKYFLYENFSGALLLSYKVDNALDPILFMSHHDVVSSNGTWEHEPFNASVSKDKLYGRGTLDTKGNLWAILTSIEELLIEGYKFNRSIYIESNCDEEVSGEKAYNIAKILKERNIHFDFTLDEGGMIVYDPINCCDATFAMVALAEKDCIDLKFIAKGNGGHSSTPDKNNPLMRLSKFIVKVTKTKLSKTSLDDLSCETLIRISTNMKGILKFFFKHSRGFRHILAKVMSKFSPTAKSIVSSTICFTTIKGSDELNVIPEEAYVTGNLRVLPNDKKEKIIKKLQQIADKFDISIETIDPGYASNSSSYKSEQFKFLSEVIESNFPDVKTAPYLSTGASDSRYFTSLSENVFRFAPFKVSNEQLDSIHAKDENVDISALIPAVNFYKDLIRRLK